jgi:hypothetical protein
MRPWMDAAAHDLRFVPLLGLGYEKVGEPLPDKNEIMEMVLIHSMNGIGEFGPARFAITR